MCTSSELYKKAVWKRSSHTRLEYIRIDHVFSINEHIDLSLKGNDMVSLMCDYEEECLTSLISYDLSKRYVV